MAAALDQQQLHGSISEDDKDIDGDADSFAVTEEASSSAASTPQPSPQKQMHSFSFLHDSAVTTIDLAKIPVLDDIDMRSGTVR